MATGNYGAKKKKMDKAVVDVPDDLIVQILLRVPARYLFQLRWACKYWYNLITKDPSFIKLNLQHSNQLTANNISVLISDNRSNMLFVNHIHGDTLSNPIWEMKLFGFRFWGPSCNGLFCIEMLKLNVICLWNPCTNELKKIPNSPLTTKDNDDDDWVITYGHGYCPNIDDYKVIRKARRYSTYGSIEIYSLRTNSWETVHNKDDPYTFYHGCSFGVGLHLNGSLYLHLHKPDHYIVCFDIENEEYRQLLMPKWTATQTMWIGELQGCLCLLINKFDLNVVEVWMTKDCGRTKESWVKSFTIRNLIVKEILMYSYKLMKFTKNGEILLRHEKFSELFWYSPKSDKTRHVADILNSWTQAEAYTETLVSLQPDVNTCEEQGKPTRWLHETLHEFIYYDGVAATENGRVSDAVPD